MKVSIIITSYNEPKTIVRAIRAIESQKIFNHETLVVAPDEDTLNAASSLKSKYKSLKILKDSGNGKPAALNFAVKKAKGEVIILTDGDVFVGKNSLSLILNHFKNKKIGAVTGNPRSSNKKDNKYGYWAYLLTEIANERRKHAEKNKLRFFCSGYLFAIRKELFPKIPEELLSEDGYISHKVYSQGQLIKYEEKAEVYVKYPNNFNDWIKQKKRSVGGYNQIKKMLGIEIRSIRQESLGAFGLLKYISNFSELLWITQLFLARVYLWGLIYKDINLRKKTGQEVWERVESTK